METSPQARCEAAWHVMQPDRVDEAKKIAHKVSTQYRVQVAFHSHDLNEPNGDVLFGARFCGEGASTYHAAKDWKAALEAAAMAVSGQ